MIRPLRQRHRRLVITLGIFLPLAFAAGIAARKSMPSMISVPDSLVVTPASFGATEWERADLFAKSPVAVRLLRETASAGRFAVELSAPTGFVKPDLIVYWVDGNSAITGTLPNDAILLGSFGSGSLVLPAAVAKSGGRLVLFSLADNEIIELSKSVGLNPSTK